MGLFDKLKKNKNVIEKNFTLYGTDCTYDQFASAIRSYFTQHELTVNGDMIELQFEEHKVVFNTNKSKTREYYEEQSLGMRNYFAKTKIPIGIQKLEILRAISKFNSIFGVTVFEEAKTSDIIKKINVIFLNIAKDLGLYILYPNMDIFDSQRKLLVSYERATSELEVVDETITSLPENQRRRAISNEYIKLLGITCYENLPMIESSSEITLKDIDTICKRAIACLLSIQVVYDIKKGEGDQSRRIINNLLDKYGVKDCLNSKEKKLFDETYTEQDLIDLDWEYETYWSLLWSLGIIRDISDASTVCDCKLAINLVIKSANYDEFKSRCNMRDVNEILDMLDLYYRYNWAITEKRINPNSTSIMNLNPSIVIERRRGLEWVISQEEDWYNIPLNT